MTEIDIDALDGVGLGRACAVEIMGWALYHPLKKDVGTSVYHTNYPGKLYVMHGQSWLRWHPWSDLRAAGEVLDKMRERWRTDDPEEMYWNLVDCQERGWRVDILWSHHDGDIVVESRSANDLPTAICRAALKAVRGESG